jgi:hypothetical protein
MIGWLKMKAPSSNPSTKKKKKKSGVLDLKPKLLRFHMSRSGHYGTNKRHGEGQRKEINYTSRDMPGEEAK